MLDAIPVASAASAARTTQPACASAASLGRGVARGRQRRERAAVQGYPAWVKATPLVAHAREGDRPARLFPAGADAARRSMRGTSLTASAPINSVPATAVAIIKSTVGSRI